MRRIACMLIVGLMCGVHAAAAMQGESPEHAAFRALYEAGQFNGAVLIAKNDSIVLDTYFGVADKLEGRPLAANSLYRLASVSKTMTATALLTLVEGGRVRLDDSVHQLLPTFPYPGVTVRHLLQHSSGLPEYIFGVGDYWDDGKGMMTNRDVLAWLVTVHPPLAFVPGESWDYCNTGYALLPLIIEAVTGESYHAYLRRAVFQPAGLRDSYQISELGPAELARVARGHGFDYGAGEDVRVDRHPVLAAEFKADSVYGAGDIFSTARDLFVFDQALKAGKVVGPALQEMAYTSMMLPEGFPAGYGLGWQVAASEFTGRIIHHHGQGDGYRTRYYRFLDKGITIVTLQNAREKYADEAVRMAQQLAFKGSFTLPKPSLAEALSRVMRTSGLDATLALVDSAAAAPARWEMGERDLNNFALTYWFQGKREVTIRLFTRYLGLAPDAPGPHATLAEALAEMGRGAEAKAHYREAVKVARQTPKRYAREIAKWERLAAP